MNRSCRLPAGGLIDRTASLNFTFNGAHFKGHPGDTLASALLANDVHFVARSWKYHRRRGIMTAGVDEPNALVQLETGAYTIPNARATEVELYEGLNATSVNANPGIEHDWRAMLQMVGRFIPGGFYYKTFMWPRRLWPVYEKLIRDTAGFGEAPNAEDPDRYDRVYAHCDVLVVGAGPAGIAAALAAGRTGGRVMLIDERPEMGGALLAQSETIDGQSGSEWTAAALATLAAMPEVTFLRRTTVYGYHDHDFLTACERLTDHLPVSQRCGPRERLWKIRAKRVVLATGAHERPIVFGNNDLPGIMMASGVSTYLHRYGVRPGKSAVVFTNNDGAYRTAIDLKANGADVKIVDPRPAGAGGLPSAAQKLGIAIVNEAVVVEANGSRHVRSVSVRSFKDGAARKVLGDYECDLLAISGGWNPALHLHAQARGTARWDDARVCFVPDVARQAHASAGAANGAFQFADALREGSAAGRDAAVSAGFDAAPAEDWNVQQHACAATLPLWLAGDHFPTHRGAKQFVDFQNDVIAADIYLSAREGYTSVEHMKRYTSLGLGTDQGKLGNINGMALLAAALGQSIPETGTTTFRPNYTPVTFGTIAGPELGDTFDPVRTTCVHEWHVSQGAVFEDVGMWKRPLFFPRANEDAHAAVMRECRAVRTRVGMMDASTLGKIDIRGPDALTLLNRIYTNTWDTLAPGRCRYGLMLDENGMVFDDGVTTRLGERHYLMSTTTGGAARVFNWMERWLQTEWSDLKVHLTSVTEQFATFAVAGPDARKVLEKCCRDIALAADAFPYLSCREATVAGIPARVMRISFSGELAFEINVPADSGRAVWETLMEAGAAFGITPYGTEAMHVLRAEKGYIIVGQDTDGSVTPLDLGMQWLVARDKDFLGKRSLSRLDTNAAGRKQLVGLLAEDPAAILPEGAQVLREAPASTSRGVQQGAAVHTSTPRNRRYAQRERESDEAGSEMEGHVTSSYLSPTLDRSIALALVKGGCSRIGEPVRVSSHDRNDMSATICSPVFYDPEGTRLRG